MFSNIVLLQLMQIFFFKVNIMVILCEKLYAMQSQCLVCKRQTCIRKNCGRTKAKKEATFYMKRPQTISNSTLQYKIFYQGLKIISKKYQCFYFFFLIRLQKASPFIFPCLLLLPFKKKETSRKMPFLKYTNRQKEILLRVFYLLFTLADESTQVALSN